MERGLKLGINSHLINVRIVKKWQQLASQKKQWCLIKDIGTAHEFVCIAVNYPLSVFILTGKPPFTSCRECNLGKGDILLS